MRSEVIVAVATPPGTGGMAVVRMSGEGALAVALRCLTAKRLEPRRATLTRIVRDGKVIDEAVATLFPAPHSYTGEEAVELSCHGSVYVQQAVLQLLTDHGARLAEPGEFTWRAFMNGRLNLSQAEAVADLIEASTPAQHRLAISQLRGGYAEELRLLRMQLVDLTALLELELDFSQEDVEFVDRHELRQLLARLLGRVDSLVDSFALGNALKQGIPVAIVGAPNAGKSTLLNALLRDDRAIVSPIPGTTRDTVEGTLTVGETTFRLIDTAGLRETDDAVERLGIERSRRAIDEAQIVVEVVDASLGLNPIPLPSHHDNKRHIRVLNKCDLNRDACHFDGTRTGDTLLLCTSAMQGIGIEPLKQALHDSVDAHTTSDTLLANVRHRDALLRVQAALRLADEGLSTLMPADLVAVDLRDALYHLGTITGEVTNDEVLGTIFSRFCVGK